MSADTAPAAMPGVEEIARLVSPLDWEAHDATDAGSEIRDIFPTGPSLEKARAILALFAPILAEKDAQVRAGEIMTQKMRELAARQKAAGKEYYDRALAAEAALAAERERAASVMDEWSKPQTMKLHAGEMTAGEVRTTQAILKGLAAAIRAQGED